MTASGVRARHANPPSDALDESIARGLSFLEGRQLPSGAFPVSVAWDPALTDHCVDDPSVFPTALIAHALSGFAGDRAVAMVRRMLAFFEAEMIDGGLWRHWSHGHPQRLAIPPDLDDTACVSAVMRRHGRPVPPNHELLVANRDRRGLFFTWLTPRLRPTRNRQYWRTVLPQLRHPLRFYGFWRHTSSHPYDVDGVVNANVLWYLGARPETEAVVDHLVAIVERGLEAECDKWYVNPFVFYYALSRAFAAGASGLGRVREAVVGRVLAARTVDGGMGESALDTALGICTLLDWRSRSGVIARAARALTAAQFSSGAWAKRAVYRGGPDRFWGSEELTTGFCLEALLRVRDVMNDLEQP